VPKDYSHIYLLIPPHAHAALFETQNSEKYSILPVCCTRTEHKGAFAWHTTEFNGISSEQTSEREKQSVNKAYEINITLNS
jgi:hypothetical protein